MKKKLILTIITLSYFLWMYSQENSTNRNESSFLNKNGDTAKRAVFKIRCAHSLRVSDMPLFILDGVVISNHEIKNLNPDDIKSIEVLKNSTTTALFCSKPRGDIIIIETKNARKNTIFIKDVSDGLPVPGATIDIIPKGGKKDIIRLIADSAGQAVTDKMILEKEYELRVSSVGYKAILVLAYQKLPNKTYEFFLKRDVKSIGEAVVVGGNTKRICYFGYRVVSLKTKPNFESQDFTTAIYPNPVNRSQAFTVDIRTEKDQRIIFRIFGLDGRLIHQNNFHTIEGLNKFSIGPFKEQPAGLYILHFQNEN